MIAEERRRRVAALIEQSGVASVQYLADQLDVAPVTITRDLRLMEQEGVIRRVRGGAISLRGASYEPPFTAREAHLRDEKQRIAARAVTYVQDGDSIVVDVGTTALEVARALKGKRNLTVIVSNIRAAAVLGNQSGIQVIVVGGKLRPGELSVVGHTAEQTLRAYHVDRAFIGVGGISVEHGLTEFNVDEAGAKRVMLERARQTIVVADHTKLGKVMLVSVAPLNLANMLITGRDANPESVAQLRDAGLDVILA